MMELDANTLKISSLVLLGLQNLAYGLLLPISRMGDKDGNVFFGPTAVVTTEIIKIVIALCGIATENVEEKRSQHHQRADSINEKEQLRMYMDPSYEQPRVTKPSTVTVVKNLFCQGSSLKLLVPSLLFVVQNNLQIQSASYLDATEFQVLSQLKLVTAAFCSVLILKRQLNIKHWTSIFLLIIGICFVQQAAVVKSPETTSGSQLHPQAFLIGSVTMLGACCFSGVASILMEYLLKNEVGFWSSNLLLATYSIIPASIPLFADVVERGSFDVYRHFTLSVWVTIFLNAIGGLLVAMVMKFADNILKGFAVAASLIATVLIQSHASVSWSRVIGSFIVVISMFGYSQASSNSATPSKQVMAETQDLALSPTKLSTVDEEGDFSFSSSSSSSSPSK